MLFILINVFVNDYWYACVLFCRVLLDLLEVSKATKMFCCANCLNPISHQRNIFKAPGTEGRLGAYVNPHGFVHQTLTVTSVELDCCILYGPISTVDSW